MKTSFAGAPVQPVTPGVTVDRIYSAADAALPSPTTSRCWPRISIAAGRLSKPSSASFSTCRSKETSRSRDRERLERLLHASLHATAGLPRSGPYDALAAAHVEDGFEPSRTG